MSLNQVFQPKTLNSAVTGTSTYCCSSVSFVVSHVRVSWLSNQVSVTALHLNEFHSVSEIMKIPGTGQFTSDHKYLERFLFFCLSELQHFR